MFVNQVQTALESASYRQIDDIVRSIYRANVELVLTDDEVERLVSVAELRRKTLRGDTVHTTTEPTTIGRTVNNGTRPPLPRHLYPTRRIQRSPDKARSIARRRTLATSGVLPPALAAHFTTGELAALTIIASEARTDRVCDCTIAEIAARAGIARTTVQNAVRRAAELGLILMTERRRPGRPSLPNLIRIISVEWKAWMKHGSRRSQLPAAKVNFFSERIGFKKLSRTGNPTDIRKGRPTKNRSKCPSGPPKAVA